MDYRDSLYNHYMHHYGYLDPYLYSRLENILHFQIYIKKNGNVRWFSTKRRLSSKVLNNRQELFEDNYSKISDILEKNFNVGSCKL